MQVGCIAFVLLDTFFSSLTISCLIKVMLYLNTQSHFISIDCDRFLTLCASIHGFWPTKVHMLFVGSRAMGVPSWDQTYHIFHL